MSTLKVKISWSYNKYTHCENIAIYSNVSLQARQKHIVSFNISVQPANNRILYTLYIYLVGKWREENITNS